MNTHFELGRMKNLVLSKFVFFLVFFFILISVLEDEIVMQCHRSVYDVTCGCL